MSLIEIKASEVVAGNEIKLDDGYFLVSGLTKLHGGKKIIFKSFEGMFGVMAGALITVKRPDVYAVSAEPKTIITGVARKGIAK